MKNNNSQTNLSIIIPCFNEELTIAQTINQLETTLKNLNLENFEIIVVNDGSTDNTQTVLEKLSSIKIINHPHNKGYGAALKTGVRASQYNWLLFFDADGQHQPDQIKNFLEHTSQYQLIVGDRSSSTYYRPNSRKLGLWFLHKTANYLVDFQIPDLNCGLRLVKKDVLQKYLHLMPNGFSMSTTSTMAFLKDKRDVKFIPVHIQPRSKNSQSTVRPRDAVTTLMLIFRLIMIFSPLRIFFPVSLILSLIGLGFLIYDLLLLNISETTIFVLLTSILIFFFGLLSDQIAAIRREINK